MSNDARPRVTRRALGVIISLVIFVASIIAAVVIDEPEASFAIRAIPAIAALAIFPILAFTWPTHFQRK